MTAKISTRIMRRAAGLLGSILYFALGAGSVSAMEFATPSGTEGLRIVVARGPIVEGDAERFRVVLKSADRNSFGLKTVVLDSMGGVVGEAFAMASVMDRDKVGTVVLSGGSCASSCAQIVFLAGRQRIVRDGGRLGLHSCRAAKDGAPSLYCNDLIAQHAVTHGTTYGPIMAFMQMTPATQVRWLDAAEADCWGLTRWPPGSDRGAKDGELPPCMLKGPQAGASTAAVRELRKYRSTRFE
jgi:hypothetical protein